MKRIAFLLLAFVLMVGVAGCSNDDSDDSPLVGTWTAQMGADDPEDPDITVTVTFKDDNTFTVTENGVASDSGTWSADGNVLTMSFKVDSETQTFTFSVDGNKLTLNGTGDDEGEHIVFTRV